MAIPCGFVETFLSVLMSHTQTPRRSRLCVPKLHVLSSALRGECQGLLPLCLLRPRETHSHGPSCPGFGGGAGGSHGLGPCSPTRLMWFLSYCRASYSHIMCAHITYVHTWHSAYIIHACLVHASHTCVRYACAHTCTYHTHGSPSL